MSAVEVTYSSEHWELLKKLRAQAADMMSPLTLAHINAVVYGSIARGDVKKTSDIDIFISTPPSPTMIEATLERGGVKAKSRLIIQATPSYAAKAYIYTDDNRGYSFPLVELRGNEAEFYNFAGSLNQEKLTRGIRVPGVDKRLMLIEPTEAGHMESPIQGREGSTARLLGVSTKIVSERVRTLERRGRVGRTGVYLKRELGRDEDISSVFNDLVNSNPALRRRTRSRK
ncbi:MAG: nucleotidyltransferase domain-containing protein [Candidatus Bathyarchaeota archaeon]|nr:nucleotidyltransferase domain-containing protein [Candidatus Bathyarchaeota archaeon]